MVGNIGHYVFLGILFVNTINCELPGKRLCGDYNCQDTLSFATASQAYTAQNEQELDLKPGVQIRVTSKNVQPKDIYWGGVINGKHGYFPFSHVIENHVFNQKPRYITSTKPQERNFDDLAKMFDDMNQDSSNTNVVASSEDTAALPAETTAESPASMDQGGEEETTEEGEEDEPSEEEEEEDEPTEEGDEETEGNEELDDSGHTSQNDKAEGNMIGGMFGGQPENVDKKSEEKEEKSHGTTEVQEADEQSSDETEVASNEDTQQDESTDDNLRTIQEEQLNKIRNSFLRRRLAATKGADSLSEVEELNKLLAKSYTHMDKAPQHSDQPLGTPPGDTQSPSGMKDVSNKHESGESNIKPKGEPNETNGFSKMSERNEEVQHSKTKMGGVDPEQHESHDKRAEEVRGLASDGQSVPAHMSAEQISKDTTDQVSDQLKQEQLKEEVTGESPVNQDVMSDKETGENEARNIGKVEKGSTKEEDLSRLNSVGENKKEEGAASPVSETKERDVANEQLLRVHEEKLKQIQLEQQKMQQELLLNRQIEQMRLRQQQVLEKERGILAKENEQVVEEPHHHHPKTQDHSVASQGGKTNSIPTTGRADTTSPDELTQDMVLPHEATMTSIKHISDSKQRDVPPVITQTSVTPAYSSDSASTVPNIEPTAALPEPLSSTQQAAPPMTGGEEAPAEPLQPSMVVPNEAVSMEESTDGIGDKISNMATSSASVDTGENTEAEEKGVEEQSDDTEVEEEEEGEEEETDEGYEEGDEEEEEEATTEDIGPDNEGSVEGAKSDNKNRADDAVTAASETLSGQTDEGEHTEVNSENTEGQRKVETEPKSGNTAGHREEAINGEAPMIENTAGLTEEKTESVDNKIEPTSVKIEKTAEQSGVMTEEIGEIKGDDTATAVDVPNANVQNTRTPQDSAEEDHHTEDDNMEKLERLENDPDMAMTSSVKASDMLMVTEDSRAQLSQPTEENHSDDNEPESSVVTAPTPVETKEMEQTVTGMDGSRSVVFDGTSIPLEEDLLSETDKLDILPSQTFQSDTDHVEVTVSTPPLGIHEESHDRTLVASSVVMEKTQVTVVSSVIQPSSAQAVKEEQSQFFKNQMPGSAHAADGDTSDAVLSPPADKRELPEPLWSDHVKDGPYTPGDFISRRPLQSASVDTLPQPDDTQNSNAKLEEEEDLAKDQDTTEEQIEEGVRPEPEGQDGDISSEDPLPVVTPSNDEQEVPPPSMYEPVTPSPPPMLDEEPFSGKIESESERLSWSKNLLSALDSTLLLLDPLIEAVINNLPPSVGEFLTHEPFGFSAPRAALLSVFATSLFGILSFSWCLKLCRGKKKDPLANIYKLEEKLFVASKERDESLEMIDKLKQEMQELSRTSASSGNIISAKDKKLQTLELHTTSLKQTVAAQEEKIKELSEQNTESANMIAEKSSQIEQLMYQNAQLSEQASMANAQLNEAWQAMSTAQSESGSLRTEVEQLTEEVTILTQSKDQLQLELEGWAEKVKDSNDEVAVLTEQQRENEKLLAFKDNELDVMRDCFLQLKAMEAVASAESNEETVAKDNDDEGSNDEVDKDDQLGVPGAVQEKINAMMDVSKVNAHLKEVTEERDSLEHSLKIEVDGRKELEDQIQELQMENEKLREGHQQATAQSKEATTKLNVLASYFKEKEIELQTSLGERAVKQRESEDQLMNVDEKARRTEEEMASYRAQVEDLKKEIENVERDFRTQIATNEKKAHENWLAARQAERDLKEAKNEAALLRQKLLDLERKQEIGGPAGLIRPLPTRGIPPPGLGLPFGPAPPVGPSPHAMGDRPISRGSGMPPSPHMRDEDILPPMRGRPPPIMDRPPPLPGGRMSPLSGWGPSGRGRSPPMFDRRSPPLPRSDRRSPPPPHFDRRSPPPPPHFDRRSPPFDRRGPPPPDRRSPPPPMFRGAPVDRRGPPPPPGYWSPDVPYRRTSPHGRPFPSDQTPPPDFRKGNLDSRSSDLRNVDPRTSSPYDRPDSSTSRNTDVPVRNQSSV